MMNTKFLFAGILAMAMGGSTLPAAAAMGQLEGGEWVLAAAGGQKTMSAQTLQLVDGKATGSDGCNRYMTTYETSGATLRIHAGKAGSTMMMCDNMEAPRKFMRALEAARRYKVSLHDLWLLDGRGHKLAHFISAAR